jgi:uncharacterized protein (DUF433 family)
MTREELLARITIDPGVCFGKPCIPGHRIWVSLVLDFLAGGMSPEEIVAEYSDLTREDVLACIACGADMARDRYLDVTARSMAHAINWITPDGIRLSVSREITLKEKGLCVL